MLSPLRICECHNALYHGYRRNLSTPPSSILSFATAAPSDSCFFPPSLTNNESCLLTDSNEAMVAFATCSRQGGTFSSRWELPIVLHTCTCRRSLDMNPCNGHAQIGVMENNARSLTAFLSFISASDITGEWSSEDSTEKNMAGLARDGQGVDKQHDSSFSTFVVKLKSPRLPLLCNHTVIFQRKYPQELLHLYDTISYDTRGSARKPMVSNELLLESCLHVPSSSTELVLFILGGHDRATILR